MVRLVNTVALSEDGHPRTGPDRNALETHMTGLFARSGDPFEGRGARRKALRLQIEGVLALAMAIVACGLTAAVWIEFLSPLGRVIGLS